jgi:hypothetical protein
MSRWLAPVLALGLALAACASDEPPASSPEKSASPDTELVATPTSSTSTPSAPAPSTAATTQAADPAARRALRAAQKAVLQADSGTIRTVVDLGPARTETVAQYQLSTRSMRAEVTMSSPDGRLFTEVIGIGKDLWFRISGPQNDGPDQTCWMTADPAAIEEATGVDVPRGSRGVPAGLAVAVSAGGTTQLGADRIIGRADLYSVAGTFSGKLPALLGLDLRNRDTAPVVVTVADGVVTGWRTSLVDVLRAMEDAGLQLPSEAEGYQDASMPNAGAEVEISDLGGMLTVTPPPSDEVVELVPDAEQSQQAMEVCGARLA